MHGNKPRWSASFVFSLKITRQDEPSADIVALATYKLRGIPTEGIDDGWLDGWDDGYPEG